MCLLIHFVLKNVYVPFGTANIMFLSFIRFGLLSFEHGNPISHKMQNIIQFCGSFVRVQSSFQSYSISFPFIFHALCPYLERLTCFNGKDLIVKSSIFVCTS